MHPFGCAAGSQFRHGSRFRKPPSHPGRSDFPSPVGGQRSSCVISGKPSHIGGGLSAHPHAPLTDMVYFPDSPGLRLPTFTGSVSLIGVILTGDHCTESPFASSGCYPSECRISCDISRHYPAIFALTGSCAGPKSSPSLGLSPCAPSLCRLLRAPAGSRPFPTLSP